MKPILQKLILDLHSTKFHKIFINCIHGLQKTFLLDINALAGLKLRYGDHTKEQIHFSQIVQNHSGIAIFTLLYLWMLEEHNCLISTSLHLPKLRYIPILQKFILHLHFTNSLKRDNVYKLCLWILKEHICLELMPQHFLRLRYRACA